ncbi:hypothetical protein P7K49_002397 [Saguinus oedipus]|uniref:Uncharacterized protein n=1 Tax=Saguinus oedipus TaxID=9490 RepID=A0ABQ9WI78_SAGOE|nr:hypothetical protein P7K49_002397 [Saguinus oedipus]
MRRKGAPPGSLAAPRMAREPSAHAHTVSGTRLSSAAEATAGRESERRLRPGGGRACSGRGLGRSLTVTRSPAPAASSLLLRRQPLLLRPSSQQDILTIFKRLRSVPTNKVAAAAECGPAWHPFRTSLAAPAGSSGRGVGGGAGAACDTSHCGAAAAWPGRGGRGRAAGSAGVLTTRAREGSQGRRRGHTPHQALGRGASTGGSERELRRPRGLCDEGPPGLETPVAGKRGSPETILELTPACWS